MNMRLWALLIIGIMFLGCTSGGEVAKNDSKADSLLNLGVSYIHRNKPASALEKLLEAERLDPKNPKIQNHLGLTYLQLDQYAQALIHFKQALALDPKYSEVRNNLAWANIRMGKYNQAVTEAQKALDDLTYKTPEYAYNNQGLAYYKMGENGKAVEAYKKALAKAPRFSTAYNNLGQSYMALEKYEDAVDAFNNAIKYQADYPQAYFNLGVVFEKQGKPAEARQAYKRVVEMASSSSLGNQASEKLKNLPE